jgi:hypothetical protein
VTGDGRQSLPQISAGLDTRRPRRNRPRVTSCAGAASCIFAGLPAHAAKVAANLDTILSRIRGAGYAGQIIYVEYPARRYGTVIAQATAQLYTYIHPVFDTYGVEVAPVFDRFETAAEPYGGNSCAAGLLLTVAGGVCNIHPTAAGHQLIASIIAEMVPRHETRSGGGVETHLAQIVWQDGNRSSPIEGSIALGRHDERSHWCWRVSTSFQKM